MAFEIFESSKVTKKTAPTVTIDIRGNFVLSASAYETLNGAKNALLMYDLDNDIIGIKECDVETNSVSVRRYPGTPPRAAISAKQFLDHYGIEHDKSKRWPAKMIEGILQVDLKVQPIEVTRKRKRNSSESEAPMSAAIPS